VSKNPFDEFIKRYHGNPVAFVKEMLQVEPDEWQAEVMMDVARGERLISIASCHGPGKSAVLSWVSVWFLLTRYPSKAVQTAPSSPQLFDALFAETRSWISNLPPYLKELLDVTSDRIALKAAKDEVFLSARTSRAESPESMQGVHSKHVLLLADEASGIPEEVFNAASGSMSGESATTILTGNPTRATGYFFDTHHKLRDHWKTYRIFARKSPLAPQEEVKEGQHRSYGSDRVSEAFVEEVKLRSGEDSNEYRIRVLGQFPTTDENTIVPRDLVEASTYRDVVLDETQDIVWGLDVARFGSDRTVLIKRQGNVVLDLQSWRNLDLMQTCSVVKAQYDITYPKPAMICVDSIGLGAGVEDRLRQLGLPVMGVNVSETPVMGNYRNLRAELWFRLKDWLTKRSCKLPKNEDLISEICTVRYTFTPQGKYQVESKEEMKKRGLRSPDLADALVLTFAGQEAITLNPNYKWNKPLRRSLSGIV
jgi:phage terminase large subunit